MSHVTCDLPPVTNAKSQNNIPSLANSPIIGSKGRSRSQNLKTVSQVIKKLKLSDCRPIYNTSFNQKSPGHPELGVSQSHRQTNTHTVTHTDVATLWLTRPRVRVSDNVYNSNSTFLSLRARCFRVLWDNLWLLKPFDFLDFSKHLWCSDEHEYLNIQIS